MRFPALRTQIPSYLALFAAIGGTAYAATAVTGADIRDRSLTGADVRPASLGSDVLRASAHTSRRGRRGPRGVRGPNGWRGAGGPNGAAGAPGLPGAAGKAGASLFEIVTKTVTVTEAVSVDVRDTRVTRATCPSSKARIGGGAQITEHDGEGNPDQAVDEWVYLNASYPVATRGWEATAMEDSIGLDIGWQLTVWVMCAKTT